MSHLTSKYTFCVLVGALSLSPQASALGAECTLIQGATISLPTGPVEGLNMVIAGGIIQDIGTEVSLASAPDGATCEALSGEGLWVTPGLIAAHTYLGVLEVSQEPSTVDAHPSKNFQGGSGIHPSFDVFQGYNPRSSLIPIARSKGVTHAIVAPSHGRLGGSGSAVALRGSTQAQALFKGGVAAYGSLDTNEGSRGEALGELEGALQEARMFTLMKSSWLSGQSRPFSYPTRELEALFPILDGSTPLVVEANRASDIEALLRLGESFPELRLVIRGGAEAHLVADLLAEAKVPVIIDPRVYGPGSFDALFARPDNPGLLFKAGVTVIIAGESTHRVGTLTQLAGIASKAGMGHAGALAAITSNPAEVFGLEGLGRLEEGRAANLVIWEGDPLEIGAQVLGVFIDGDEVSLRSRQDALFERYRTLPGTPVDALALPESD